MELTTNDSNKKINIKSILLFIGSLIVSLILTWLLKEDSYTDSQTYALFILFFATALWVTEAIAPFAVGLVIMAYLAFTFSLSYLNSEPEKIDKYLNTFSSNIIWLFLGGFFLSAALTKTRLNEKLLKLTLKFSGTNPRNILIALMGTTMISSAFMSYTATTSMIVAAILPLLKDMGKSDTTKAFLLGISIAASTGAMGTIIGSSSNVIAAAALEKVGIIINFADWMLYGFPIAIILTVISCWVLIKLFIKNHEPISLSFMKTNEGEKVSVSKIHQNIVIVVIVVTILLWMTTTIHGISVSGVSAIPIVVLTVTGILTGDDINALPWDTLLLVAGGLSLGVAIESTGILNSYANQIKGLDVGIFALIIILAYINMIFSNVMSNTAATILLIQIGIAIVVGHEKELAISNALASSAAILLPVATPPNAIVYSTGFVDQKDFRIGGILIGILGPILAVIWVMLIA